MKGGRGLGPEVVKQLLPHRQPLLLVDRVDGYERAPRPALRASKYISLNEPVFAGHLGGIAIWPGVYTLEGLGQSCLLLHLIWALEQGWERAGRDPAEVLEALEDVERAALRQPVRRPEMLSALRAAMGEPMGLAAADEIRYLQPVFAGVKLEYHVAQTHLSDSIARFEVEARVGAQVVARGVHHATRGVPLWHRGAG